MKRLAAAVFATVGLIGIVGPQAAWAGSPHFVSNTVQATIDGNTLTVSGKEAGLGDEEQVHIVVTAEAACINPGNNHPKAANKESFSRGWRLPGPERQGELQPDRRRPRSSPTARRR